MAGPPPPWLVESADGFLHSVGSKKELVHVSKTHGLRNEYLRDHIGLIPNGLHRDEHKGWQCVDRVQWMRHEGTGLLVAVAGGAANFAAQYSTILRRCGLEERDPPHDRCAQQFCQV